MSSSPPSAPPPPPPPSFDPVHRPSHYNQHPSGIECKTICYGLPFELGCAIKYAWRYQLAGKPEQDLGKLLTYLEACIANHKPWLRNHSPAGWFDLVKQVRKSDENTAVLSDVLLAAQGLFADIEIRPERLFLAHRRVREVLSDLRDAPRRAALQADRAQAAALVDAEAFELVLSEEDPT